MDEFDKLLQQINEVTHEIYTGPAYARRPKLRTYATDDELLSAHTAHTQEHGIPVVDIEA